MAGNDAARILDAGLPFEERLSQITCNAAQATNQTKCNSMFNRHAVEKVDGDDHASCDRSDGSTHRRLGNRASLRAYNFPWNERVARRSVILGRTVQ